MKATVLGNEKLGKKKFQAATSEPVSSITKAEAQAYREQLGGLSMLVVKNCGSTSLEVKLQQFNTLLAWARQFDWTAAARQGCDDGAQSLSSAAKAYRG